jgi:FkbM family methyltransferase
LNQLARTVGFILDHPMGRRHPMRCLGRFAAWQMRSRLSQGPHRVDFVGRTHFLARQGEVGVSGNIYVGLHEFADMAFVAHALRPGDLFLDVGANAGSYTVLAAGWSGADVIAIEPAPDAFARLEANVSSNGLSGRVELHRVAVGASDGTATFTAGNDSTNHVVRDGSSPSGSTIEVPMRTLDTILAGRTPRIIKLDVEGFEREALQGAAATLMRPQLDGLLVEILAGPSRDDRGPSAFQILRDAGFTPYRYDPWQRRLAAADESSPGNVLFLRNPALLAARTSEAPALPVFGEGI